MRFEVNFVHLVAGFLFLKFYQCEQDGQIFAPRSFPTFIYIVLSIFLAFLTV